MTAVADAATASATRATSTSAGAMVDGFLSDGWMPHRPAAPTTTSAQTVTGVEWVGVRLQRGAVDAPLGVGYMELAFVL